MTILGIDPGTIRMGYAIVKTHRAQSHEILSLGYINLSDIEEHPERLKVIFEEIEHLIQKYRPDALSIESPFYGKNVQSMLKLGRAQGIAMAVAFAHQLSVTEYSPKKIKLSITGNGNASKEQVLAMLKNILKFDYTEAYLDAADALAAAMCHCFQLYSSIPYTPSKKSSSKKNKWQDFLDKNPHRKI